MSVILEVFKELFSMFMTDARLTLSTLALIAIIAVLVLAAGLSPVACGALLIIGCVGILIEATSREARKRRN